MSLDFWRWQVAPEPGNSIMKDLMQEVTVIKCNIYAQGLAVYCPEAARTRATEINTREIKNTRQPIVTCVIQMH